MLREAALGALLTGLMVLVFLRDWRSAGIVVVTIPFALLAAVIALWGAGQTINVMTLGGLALAVGILVDEATVAIENIHTHLARGVPVAEGVLDASGEVVVPRLLAMLSVVAVFVPSFFMTGVSRSLFVPLSLAVGFSMIASFFLSSSLVPVLSVWLLGSRRVPRAPSRTRRTGSTDLRNRLGRFLQRVAPARWILVTAYAAVTIGIVVAVGLTLGREIFPAGGVSQFQLRFRAPAGTKFESTERLATDVLDEIKQAAGPNNVEITLGLCRCPALVVPDQHDLPVDRWFARRRAAGGVEAGGRHSTHRLRGNVATAIQRTLSDRAVFVRAGRHRQPDHELWHVDPGRGRDHRTGFPGQPDVCGQGPGRARAHSRASRSAVRPGARLPGDSGRREPSDGGPTRRHRRSGRALLCRRDVVQPVRRAELLGRSAHGHRVSGADRSATTADDQLSTICA